VCVGATRGALKNVVQLRTVRRRTTVYVPLVRTRSRAVGLRLLRRAEVEGSRFIERHVQECGAGAEGVVEWRGSGGGRVQGGDARAG